ncbi:hypothetical protein [Alkalimarinus coralli]|uniref:hypothetical protein n=1 Tax=Alkalimarinus coralli TaxID=2935863 RepID=UPI00202AFAEC|nr:hypothetical protein [Alkalimarinus coralli]
MFEEATLYRQSEVPTVLTHHPDAKSDNCKGSDRAQRLSQLETVQYWHAAHATFVRQWVAPGYIKKQPPATCRRWFLYSEYKDGQGNNCYTQKSFRSLSDAVHYAEVVTTKLPLPGL